MSLIIPKKLQVLVETYLNAMDRKKEMGGYFFGHDSTFTGFLPMPNYNDHPYDHYSFQNTRSIADGYAKMLNAQILADMHTHPNGTVPSEQDSRYVQCISWPNHLVIVDRGNEWEWFVLDKQLRTVQWINSNIELEAYAETIASETGLTYLGQVFLTQNGEVVGRPKARQFVEVDADTWRVSRYVEESNRENKWHRLSYSEASKKLGIPPLRIKKAFKKLGLESGAYPPGER